MLVESENSLTGERLYCCQAYLTFVAIDSNNKPLKVPQLDMSNATPMQIEAFEMADRRRGARVKKRRSSMAHLPAPLISSPPRKASVHENDDDISTPFSKIHQQPLAPTTPKTKSAHDSFTEIVEIVFPEHANSLGITFGGQIMKWMEYCAIMAATRHCRSNLIIGGIDSLNFLKSTKYIYNATLFCNNCVGFF